MSAATDIADALREHFTPEPEAEPTVEVIGYADLRQPDVGSALVACYLLTIEPSAFGSGYRKQTVEIMAAVPTTTPGRADEDLDDLMSEILLVLDGITWAEWTSAERVVYMESFPAFKITVTKEGTY